MTQAIVLRNRFGPAALWLLRGDDAPDQAQLPPGVAQDPRAQNMASKGPGQTWQEWGEYLASQPLLGDWQLTDVPDGLDASEALAWMRYQDTEQAFSSSA